MNFSVISIDPNARLPLEEQVRVLQSFGLPYAYQVSGDSFHVQTDFLLCTETPVEEAEANTLVRLSYEDLHLLACRETFREEDWEEIQRDLTVIFYAPDVETGCTTFQLEDGSWHTFIALPEIPIPKKKDEVQKRIRALKKEVSECDEGMQKCSQRQRKQWEHRREVAQAKLDTLLWIKESQAAQWTDIRSLEQIVPVP